MFLTVWLERDRSSFKDKSQDVRTLWVYMMFWAVIWALLKLLILCCPLLMGGHTGEGEC